MDADLPGADVIAQGLVDLGLGLETVPALLVAIGAPRLRGLVDVPDVLPDEPNRRLYALLRRDGTPDPYSAYNAWIRTLVSFERAAEGRQFRAR